MSRGNCVPVSQLAIVVGLTFAARARARSGRSPAGSLSLTLRSLAIRAASSSAPAISPWLMTCLSRTAGDFTHMVQVLTLLLALSGALNIAFAVGAGWL
jgi:hypothetical protein